MKEKDKILNPRISEFLAVALIGLSIFLLVSIISFNPYDISWVQYPPQRPVKNYTGWVGAYVSGSLILLFGIGSYIIVAFLAAWGWSKFKSKPITKGNLIGLAILLLVSCTLFHKIPFKVSFLFSGWGGLLGNFFADLSYRYLGMLGSYIVLGILLIISIMLSTNFSIFSLRGKKRKVAEVKEVTEESAVLLQMPEDTRESPRHVVEPVINIHEKENHKPIQTRFEFMDEEYEPPSINFLKEAAASEDFSKKALQDDAQKLVDTLKNFGIVVNVSEISRGPVITRFEVQPSPGVKVSSIVTLSNDLALALAVPSVRIEAPVPGKAVVGIEIPNANPGIVTLRELIESVPYSQSKSPLVFGLGKDVAGVPLVADLEEMPHLLVAGATGSGKSVFIYSLILSLLYRNGPADLRFVFIDPKMVELSAFDNIPHLTLPVIKDAKEAGSAMKWLVREMENRYHAFVEKGVHNIHDYNDGKTQMPYLVIIIDELADLMLVAGLEIEDKLCRIAQMGRAVGMHLVLATQRPSVDIITGIIKANFPSRISFAVSTAVDSRTILDFMGAEKLIGKGDMLYSRTGVLKPTRIQGAFVSREEVKKVVTYLKDKYGKAEYAAQRLEDLAAEEERVSNDEEDTLFIEALRIVIRNRQASTSLLQRRLKIGYNRAARIIEDMHAKGIVGAPDGAKPRDILVDEGYLRKLEEGNK